MPRLEWDKFKERLYETGVKDVVLYTSTESDQYGKGVAWNGVTAITESPSGAESTPLYADDIKYLNLTSVEELGLTIEAYTYPEEFAECDGTATLIAGAVLGQQTRKQFGLCYKTTLGNDDEGNDYGYKLHIVYGCKAAPSEKAYATINDSPEAITFSWEVSTTPVDPKIAGLKPTSVITIDSSKFTTTAQKNALKNLEDILYGVNADSEASITDKVARLPLPAEIKTTLTVTAG